MIYGIINILAAILMIFGGVCFIVLLSARLRVFNTNSMDETVKELWKGFKKLVGVTARFSGKAVSASAKVIYEEATGKCLPNDIVNAALILTNDEVMRFIGLLDDRLYEIPYVINYTPNSNAVLWLDIQAIGLHEKYKTITGEEIKKLAMNLLQRFYQEIRNFSVNAVILAATPQRLYLAIPLSVNGQKYLEKMVNTSISLPEDTEKSRTAKRLREPIFEVVPPMAEPKEKDQG